MVFVVFNGNEVHSLAKSEELGVWMYVCGVYLLIDGTKL